MNSGIQPRLTICRVLTIHSFREELEEKPRVIEELSRNNQVVQEVNFDTMLNIVQSCNEVNAAPIVRNFRKLSNKPQKVKSDEMSALSLLRGIAPGLFFGMHLLKHT